MLRDVPQGMWTQGAFECSSLASAARALNESGGLSSVVFFLAVFGLLEKYLFS